MLTSDLTYHFSLDLYYVLNIQAYPSISSMVILVLTSPLFQLDISKKYHNQPLY